MSTVWDTLDELKPEVIIQLDAKGSIAEVMIMENHILTVAVIQDGSPDVMLYGENPPDTGHGIPVPGGTYRTA